MSALAPILEAFFIERLGRQRRASPNTIAAYRDTFRLLLGFAYERRGKAPAQLELADLDAALIGAFLDHLEVERANSVRTRNARLAAIHSLFRYAALREPAHAELIARVLAIPQKGFERNLISFLTPPEVDALLAAPDRSSWRGRRDHALLVVAIQTGLRVSELAGLHCRDVVLGTGAHLRCHGKGRKERVTPLTRPSAAILAGWLRERAGLGGDPLFPTSGGRPLGRDAIRRLVGKYSAIAARVCPSLRGKQVSPHVLRHTCAMQLRDARVDGSVIALVLGHEHTATTDMYLHADLAMKERALAAVTPLHTAPGRYRAPDALLAFLEAL